MKRTVRLNKTDLKNLIAESVRRTMKEWNNDYEGNDLDYDSIQMQAMSVIPRMEQSGQAISWRSVAEQMGFRLETLNGEDMELLKDAIEDVMYEDEKNPHWKEDMEFENDFQNLPYANESRKKTRELTGKILAEVTRRLKGNEEQETSWHMDNSPASLNESANTRYKGFKCVNTSNDPSFPTYAVVSPQGEQIATTLFPSEMKEIVDEYLRGER